MDAKSKSSFWQALVLTVGVFVVGIFLGIAYEGSRLDEISEYYVQSEIFLMDSLALSMLTDLDWEHGQVRCEVLIDSNIEFADRIYTEARLLERYEEAGKLTDTLKLAHKRYNLLRTILWMNTMNIPQECKGDTSVVVYLYEWETEDVTKQATNRVFERILLELKQEMGNRIILIPIAADSNLISLDSLLKGFDIPSYPAVIINEEHVVTGLSSANDLKAYLNN